MAYLRLLLILILSTNLVHAYYPSGKIKLHNAKLISHKKESLNNSWLKYIEKEKEILNEKDKDYSVDQYCSFSIEANNEGHFNLDSIKLLKHKNNLAYNLKAIQFLREKEIKVKQKKDSKPIEIEFEYLSF